jgi:hypothetical protein
MSEKSTAQTFVQLVPVAVLAFLGLSFLVLYEYIVIREPDIVAVIAFSSSPLALLVGYLAMLAVVFNAHPGLPWSELE